MGATAMLRPYLAAFAWFTCSAFASDAIDGSTYDYVIVGGGTAGLVVANRLTEDRRTTVLVIERGYFDDKPEAYIPYYATAVDTTQLMSARSAPNPKLNNQTHSVTVAAVVGGATIVNGMGCTRGSKADYDAWEELGNPGWGWHGILPYFKKSSTFIPPVPETAKRYNITWDASLYGQGPLQHHIPDFQYPDIATFWDAIRNQPGLRVGRESNAGFGPGAYWTTLSIDARNQTRCSSRSAYYDPVYKTRPNLNLVTGQTAAEILFRRTKPLTAHGIRIVSRLDNKARSVYAKKEVIVSAGAVMTPHLLQLSGIGPESVLRAAGVAVKLDLPSVGANFQDHATTVMQFSLGNQSFPNADTISTNATYNATAWAEYFANKTGPITTPAGDTVAYYSLPQILGSNTAAQAIASRALGQDPTGYLPDIYSKTPSMLKGFLAQRAILADRYTSNSSSIAGNPFRANGFGPFPMWKPLSRGEITLNRTHPSALPIVQYNTFQNPIDEQIVVSILRKVRRFWQSPQLAPLGPITELAPGAHLQTDEEILGELKRNSSILRPSLAHPSGTCAMMPEKLGGCVDSKLRVHGVKGLRVVDASIMPLIVGTSLQATVYAIAEKAADIIKQG